MKSLYAALALVILSALPASAQTPVSPVSPVCTLNLAGATKPGFTVTLNAAGVPATPTQLHVGASPNGTVPGTPAFKACNGVKWTVTANDPWLLVQGASSFTQRQGAASLKATATANSGTARAGSYTLTAVTTPGVTPVGGTFSILNATVTANQAGQ